MKIISVSRRTFFECFRYHEFSDDGTTAELALVKKKPKNSLAFFSLPAANIHDKERNTIMVTGWGSWRTKSIYLENPELLVG